MSKEFRELLRKVGSGTHTSKSLTRSEAKAAAKMMLLQEATPAQIGAFLIAHRIKRPTGEELAGMLDAYDELGQNIPQIPNFKQVTILSSPYDGRSRTAPLSIITGLILASVGIPVLMHGGDRMPTKEGLPLISVWQGLGVDWSQLSLEKVSQILERENLGFYYLPKYFPLANDLIPYREQIGKRPPLATLELIWSPYRGDYHLITGYVHPPTEKMIRDAFSLRGVKYFTTVKGLEGSCDLPSDRTAIIGCNNPETNQFERLHLNPRNYDLSDRNIPLEDSNLLLENIIKILQNEPSPWLKAAIWNGAFYLWHKEICSDLSAGIELVKNTLSQGKAWQKLKYLQNICSQ